MAGVAIEYLQNIGHTLRTYLNNDDTRKKYSEEVCSYIIYLLISGNTLACSGIKWR